MLPIWISYMRYGFGENGTTESGAKSKSENFPLFSSTIYISMSGRVKNYFAENYPISLQLKLLHPVISLR